MIELEVFSQCETDSMSYKYGTGLSNRNNSDHVTIFKICFNDNKTLQ